MKAEIVLPGRPMTKKNHSMIVGAKAGRPRMIQAKPYREYEEACLWRLKMYRGPHFAGRVNLCAHYWMPSRASWPDLMGLVQATADILERAEILDNDRQVASLDGSRIMGVDKLNPRAEIEIEEVVEKGA